MDPQSHLLGIHQLYVFISGMPAWILRVTVRDSPTLRFCFRYAGMDPQSHLLGIHQLYGFLFQVCRHGSSESPVRDSPTLRFFCFRYPGRDPDSRERSIKRYVVGQLHFSRALKYSTSGLFGSSATNIKIGFVCLFV